MKFSMRNKLNSISRWNKIQNKERKYIESHKDQYLHLKSRLFGFLAGDGNILIGNRRTNFHHSVRFFPDHESLIAPYCEAFLKVYNKQPKIQKLKNHYLLNIDSKVVVQDIVKDIDFGLLKWNVPRKILIKDNHKIEWLKAFFDCESYVGKKHIKVQSVNKLGMEQVKELLLEFDIKSHNYQYSPKNPRWNTNYILIINKKSDRKKYLDCIGFNHSLKQKKLKDTLKIYI